MKKNLLYLFIVFLLTTSFSIAQDGNTNSFNFLVSPVSARVSALGGLNITNRDSDVNSFFYNPALISDSMNTSLSTGFQYHIAGIRNNSFAYAHKIKNIGTLVFGVLNTNYGTMDQIDASGNQTGTYTAGSNAIVLGYAKKIQTYTLGMNLKFAHSSFANYSSTAIMADFGVHFKHPKKNMNVGMVIKNAGFIAKKYTENTEQTDLPLDVQLGLNYKLEHMPMRFTITGHHLYKYDIRYINPNAPKQYDLSGNLVQESNGVYDKILKHTDIIFRHFVFGSEFLFGKNFNLRLGYNHQMRKEMKIPAGDFNFSGFSTGFMMRIRGIAFHYSYANVHPAKGINTIQLDFNFNRRFRNL